MLETWGTCSAVLRAPWMWFAVWLCPDAHLWYRLGRFCHSQGRLLVFDRLTKQGSPLEAQDACGFPSHQQLWRVFRQIQWTIIVWKLRYPSAVSKSIANHSLDTEMLASCLGKFSWTVPTLMSWPSMSQTPTIWNSWWICSVTRARIFNMKPSTCSR